MKRIAIILMALVCCASISQAKEKQSSPNGKVKVEFDVVDGIPQYAITYKGKDVIGGSTRANRTR